MTRKDVKTYSDDLSAAKFTIDTRLEIWGTNSTLKPKKVSLSVKFFHLNDKNWTEKEIMLKGIELKPNASTELWSDNLPGQPQRTKDSQVPKPIVASARLLDDKGEVIARYSNWSVASPPLHILDLFSHQLPRFFPVAGRSLSSISASRRRRK